MQSKKQAGLFFGRRTALTLDGPIGGYNFQAAWSTGWAGGNASGGRVTIYSTSQTTTRPEIAGGGPRASHRD